MDVAQLDLARRVLALIAATSAAVTHEVLRGRNYVG
jgi:hypothetical protein